MSQAAAEQHGEGHEHHEHLAHHFENMDQQFAAGKLGMWLFLATEILLFGGLFCAYAVYRANHPEIFEYAHVYLDKWLGGINTLVLISSSLTMAWAVRCAQLGQRRLQIVMLSLTLLGGCGFMGIKYTEYSHKWHEGLLWGTYFNPAYAPGEEPAHGEGHGDEAGHDAEHAADDSHAAATPISTSHDSADFRLVSETENHGAGAEGGADAHALAAGMPKIQTVASTLRVDGKPLERTQNDVAGTAPGGLAYIPGESEHPPHAYKKRPPNVHIFFGIYFSMTALHGLHVLAGMIVITWILVRTIKGDFGPQNFAAVDFVGLYWHLVDLIWIFLFPLLYLID